MDDLESVLDNTNSHQLLSVVASVHHEGVGETLDNWALSLAESLDVEATSGVRKVLLELVLLVHGKVIRNCLVRDNDVIEGPWNEKHDQASKTKAPFVEEFDLYRSHVGSQKLDRDGPLFFQQGDETRFEDEENSKAEV